MGMLRMKFGRAIEVAGFVVCSALAAGTMVEGIRLAKNMGNRVANNDNFGSGVAALGFASLAAGMASGQVIRLAKDLRKNNGGGRK